jgi:hypothetical protein
MKAGLAGIRATRENVIALVVMVMGALAFAIYSSDNGFSYKEVIVGLGGVMVAVIVFGGERGIRFGFVLWVLTLALGYRTIEWTKDLRIHPSEMLLWLLVACICAHRQLIARNLLSFPWWLWLLLPFLALGWWPMIVGTGQWDRMFNEFRDFLLIIPLLIVASIVLQKQNYWRYVLLAMFAVSTWIAVMGVAEYWFPSVTRFFPAFISAAKPESTADGFVRAQFSFWGGAQATFICILALPAGLALAAWWRGSWSRMAIIAASVIQMLAIYIGGYRSVWFVLVVQVSITCILRLNKHGVAVALVCVAVAVAGYHYIPNTEERVISGIEALRGAPTDHSALDRKERALGAFTEAIESPFGNGWASAGWVHSDFLQVAANLGILAAFIFVGGYLHTLMRLFKNTLQSLRAGPDGDLALSLLLGFIAAGAHLALQGVEVLPQMVLPVWLVWVLVDIRLRQPAEVQEIALTYAPANLNPVADFQ